MRLRVLCEDRKTENLVRRLCDAWGIGYREARISVAPSVRGAASAWVLAQYADHLAGFRAVANHQLELGLLVVVDGDSQGVVARKSTLEARAGGASGRRGAPRGKGERVAIWVPTWSVETWLLWLGGEHSVDEATSYKADDRVRSESVSRAAGEALAEFLRGRKPGLASLDDARVETARLPGAGRGCGIVRA